MTPAQLAELNTVNLAVNAIAYQAAPGVNEPPDLYLDEPIPGDSWVCRMYVQEKATRLRALGWPDDAGQLLELICVVETGERHAVLQVADVDMPGDPYILDSRFDFIYRRSTPPPGYQWQAVQVAGTTTFEAVS